MPNRGLPRSRPLPERFWEKVERRGPAECWPWKGATDRKGYGKTAIGRRQLRATHVAWSLQHGRPFPGDLYALHTCDNPNCVNPAHIRPGTHLENMREMTERGRRRKGHCPNGHEYVDGSYSLLKGGRWRSCLICKREMDRAYRERRREKRLATRLEAALTEQVS